MRQEYHIEGQTTNEINKWFSGHLECYEHSLLDYKDKTLDQQNQLLSKCVNKKFVAVEDITKTLRTIVGGHLKGHPEFTIDSLNSLIQKLDEK